MSLQAIAIYLSVALGIQVGALAERLETLRSRVGGGEEGQAMVEYVIIAALIGIAAMAAIQAFGGGVAQVFTNLLGRIQGIGG